MGEPVVGVAGRRPMGVRAIWSLVGVVLVLGGLLIGRLVQWQVVERAELSALADQVNTRESLAPAVRGRILGLDGTPLVSNEPSSVLTMDPQVLLESPDEGRALLAAAARELGLEPDRVWGRTRLCGTAGAPPVPSCFSGSPYQPIPVAYDVDPVTALGVLEHPEDYPGLTLSAVPVRSHPVSEINAAHVLGYLGRPTRAEVDAADGSLSAGDLVGRTGLEAVYDEQLRGTPGRSTLSVDPRGVVTGTVTSTAPQRGLDLRTHVQPAVQAHVERVLARTVRQARADDSPPDSAAAVVLDVRTGGVVAAASWPSYDPQIWIDGVTQDQLDRLSSPDGGEPLVNRVLGETFPPASTYKVISLPAAIQSGIDPDKKYACPGSVQIAGQTFRNFKSRDLGSLDLRRAIEVSCDTVFYRWAFDNWRALGGLSQTADLRDPWVLLSQDFGLGSRTGIDLPGETPGVVPGREWKRAYWEATRDDACARAESGYPQESDAQRRRFLEQLARESCAEGYQYRAGDAANFAIGQGDVAATPLQMAVVYAAVANGGTLWTPQVADALLSVEGDVVEDFAPEKSGQVFLEEATWQILRDGLEGVNVRGTGAPAFAGFDLDTYPVAGKTGSAESFGRRSTGWYASYGPADDPRYAVVVVLEQGGIGGEIAAPAARSIWDLLRTLPAQ
ncbi:MAG: penicillin-binding protein 2 [Ornithinimicrobium sp.]|uniref:penicillin-binding protein 2 n=1 Tax=Ornithinimicrobium sp. TaxID=1977084 RepID=UPI003D9BA300